MYLQLWSMQLDTRAFLTPPPYMWLAALRSGRQWQKTAPRIASQAACSVVPHPDKSPGCFGFPFRQVWQKSFTNINVMCEDINVCSYLLCSTARILLLSCKNDRPRQAPVSHLLLCKMIYYLLGGKESTAVWSEWTAEAQLQMDEKQGE